MAKQKDTPVEEPPVDQNGEVASGTLTITRSSGKQLEGPDGSIVEVKVTTTINGGKDLNEAASLYGEANVLKYFHQHLAKNAGNWIRTRILHYGQQDNADFETVPAAVIADFQSYDPFAERVAGGGRKKPPTFEERYASAGPDEQARMIEKLKERAFQEA